MLLSISQRTLYVVKKNIILIRSELFQKSFFRPLRNFLPDIFFLQSFPLCRSLFSVALKGCFEQDRQVLKKAKR